MGINKSKIQSYIEKHKNHKKWIALMLCATLLTGTGTMYVLNKPATAMTAEGAESIGVVMDSASAESESTFWEPIPEEEAASESSQAEGTDASDSSETGVAIDESNDTSVEGLTTDNSDEVSDGNSNVADGMDNSDVSGKDETNAGSDFDVSYETEAVTSNDNAGVSDETSNNTGDPETTLGEAKDSDTSSEEALSSEEQNAEDEAGSDGAEMTIPESVNLADYVTETIFEKLDENGEWVAISKEDINFGDELRITYKYSIPKNVAASDDIHMDIPQQYGKAESESNDLSGQNGTYEVTDDNEIKIQYSDEFKAVVKEKISTETTDITVGAAKFDVFDSLFNTFIITAHAEEGDNINGEVSARLSLSYDPSKDNTSQGVTVTDASIIVRDSSGKEVTYDGNPIDKAETIKINDGEQIKFVTGISVDPTVVTEENNVFFLDLGYRGIVSAYGSGKQELYNSKGNRIGSYEIVCDYQGKCYVKFVIDPEIAKQQYKDQELVGYFNFWMTLSNSEETTTEAKIIKFNDDVTFKIEVTDKNKYDLAIEKTAPEGYNKETGKIKYHVVIRSTKGTGGDIKLEDIISVNNNWQLNSTIVTVNSVRLVGCWKFNGEPASTGGEQINVNLDYNQNEQNKFVATIPGLEAGQSYVLDYEFDVPDELKNNPSGIEINNKVSAQTEKVDRRETSINTKIDGSYPDIDKHGDEVSTSDKDKKIKWTIVLNSNNQSLDGYTLKDVFITKDVNGELIRTPYVGKMSISPALPGNVTEIDVTESGYTFNFSGNTEAAHKTYTLTYEVPYYDYQKIDKNRIVNEASLNPNAGEPITDTGVVYPTEAVNPVEKDGTGYELDGNDKTFSLNWKVTLKTPIVKNAGNGNSEYWVYYDELDGNQIITDDQLKNIVITGINKCKIEGNNPVTLGDTGITGYRGFAVTVYEDLDKKDAVLTYKTTATKTNTQTTYENTGYVYNKDFSDTGINEYYPIISKYDGNGKHGDSEPVDYTDPGLFSQGILTWRIRVDIPAGVKYKDLIITDTLPDDVTLLADGVYSGQQLYGLEVAGNDSFTDATPFNEREATYSGIKFEKEVNGQNIIVKFRPGQSDERRTLWFRIRAKINDDVSWANGEKKEFTNHVSIKDGDNKELGFDDQKQIITKDDSVISKTGNLVEGNLDQIEYTVDINPQNRKLLKNGTLTLHDSLTTYFAAPYSDIPPITVEFVRENFKIEVDELDENGNVVRTRPLENDEYNYHQKNSEPQVISDNPDRSIYEVISAIEISGLPADRHIKVRYTYYFAGDGGITIKTSNTASLEGLDKEEVTNPTNNEFQTMGSEAGFDASGINLVKVDRDNAAITLPDAVFRLYKWDEKNGNKKYVLQDGIVKTNGSGIATVTGLDFNTAYYFEEETPPEGYLINKEKLYFCIRNDDTNKYPVYIPEDFDGIYSFGGENLEFADVKEKTSISVDKIWDYSNNSDNTLQTKTVDVIIGRRYGDLITENNDTYYSVNITKRQTYVMEGKAGIVQYKGLPSVPSGKKVTVEFYLYKQDPYNNKNVQFTHNGEDIDLTKLPGYDDAVANGGYVTYSFIVNEDTTIDMTYHDNPPDFSVTLSDETKRGTKSDPIVGTEDTSFKLNENMELPDANKITLSDPQWHKTIEGLDKYIYVGEKKYKALYYVQEITGYGYDDSYSDNQGGIDSGTITITNKRNDKEAYTLPSTGGTGTIPYTMGGLFVILMSMLGCMLFNKGGYSSSNIGLYAKAFKQSAHLHLYKYSNMSKQTRFKRGERNQMRGIKTLLTGVLAGVMALSMTFTAGTAITAKAEATGTKSVGNGAGSITVENAIEGEAYSLYKLFDFEPTEGDPSKGVYTIKDNDPWYSFVSAQTGYLTLTAKGAAVDGVTTYYVKWADGVDSSNSITGLDTTPVAAFAKLAEQALEGKTALGTVEADGTGAKFTGVEYGYYLVKSSVGALVGINTVNKDVNIKEKNSTTTTEKKVEEDSSREGGEKTGKYGDRDDAEIGQDVWFRSTVTIPAGGAHNVVFYDKMTDGLTFGGVTNVTVAVGDTVLTSEQAHVTEGGKVENEDVTFNIVFDDAFTSAVTTETTITIDYKATLNEKAEVGLVTGGLGQGNDNKSMITYGNSGKTSWDWTRTYTYSLNIFKHNDADEGLAGAEFSLYRGTDAQGDAIALVDLGTKTINNVEYKYYRFATAEDATKTDVTITTKMVTPASGYIYIEGFDGDSYSVKETKAPDGFNLDDGAKPVIITAGASKQYDTNVDQIKDITVAYSTETGTPNVQFEADTLKFLNSTGALLPSTGGIGTTIFYIIGGLLIIAAVVFFVVRRKADAE